MALNYTKTFITDFSGGITDKYVSGISNEHEVMDNFVLNALGDPVVRYGYEVVYEAEVIVRIDLLFLLKTKILLIRQRQVYLLDESLGTVTLIPTTTAQPIFQYVEKGINSSSLVGQNILTGLPLEISETTTLYDYPVRVYQDKALDFHANTAGLIDPLETMGSVLYSPPSGTFTYLYAYLYSYEYEVDGITYEDVSDVVYSQAVPTYEIGVAGFVTITVFGGIFHPTHYQPASIAYGYGGYYGGIRLKIYRTENNGSVYYEMNDLQAPDGDGTTDFIMTDNTTDAALVNKAKIYTSGGVLPFAQAPKCSATMVARNIVYYMNVDLTRASTPVYKEYRQNRICQGVPGNTGSYIPSAYIDLSHKVIGGGEYKGIPIVMTERAIYRIEGVIDTLGNGYMIEKEIDSGAGCLSHKGIVKTSYGLYWMGINGVYRTDGYIVELVSSRLEKHYSKYNGNNIYQNDLITGDYDKKNERVNWGVSDGGNENNLLFILNLRTSGFTTASGESFYAPSLLAIEDDLYRGGVNGHIYRHNESQYSDFYEELFVSPSLWKPLQIPFLFRSLAHDLGDPSSVKWVKDVTLIMKSATNTSLALTSIDDDKARRKKMKEIRRRRTFLWGDVDFIWGDDEVRWRIAEVDPVARHFPKTGLRSKLKQIELSPAEINLFDSDIWGKAGLTYEDPQSPSVVIVELTDPADKWPVNIRDANISFEDDDYYRKYRITSRDSDTIIKIIGGNLIVGLDQKWVINGALPDQRFQLKTITYSHASLSNTENKYQSEEDGGNK